MSPEFRLVWVSLLGLGIAFALTVLYAPPQLAMAQAGLLLIAAGIFLFITYRWAVRDREGAIGESQLRSILFNLEDALIFYDKDFKALFFNPAAEKLFNMSTASVVGHHFEPKDVEEPGWRTLTQVMFPSLAPTVVSRSRAGEYPQILDVSFPDPILELRISTLPVTDRMGLVAGFLKVIRNRTREVSLLKSKEDFLTIASHQLRTPLTEVMWGIEAILGDKSLSPESQKMAERAYEASHGLMDIIEDLLNVSKIEEGHFGYTFEANDIVLFIEEMVKKVAPLAEKVGIKVYFEKPRGAFPKPFIDKSKLALALGNLLENAVRYNAANGEVSVRVKTDKGFVEVAVQDTGMGIAPAELENLFKKFYRAPSAMKSYTSGSGLGLYITKTIVEAHGGTIEVESEPGRGTIFRFTVPAEEKLLPRYEVSVE